MVRLDNMPDVLTVTEAAEVLRIGRSAAYRMARNRTLPTIALGRRLVVPKKALVDMLDGSQAVLCDMCREHTAVYLNPSMTAELFETTEQWLYERIHVGDIPCRISGDGISFKVQDLDSWFVERDENCGPEGPDGWVDPEGLKG